MEEYLIEYASQVDWVALGAVSITLTFMYAGWLAFSYVVESSFDTEGKPTEERKGPVADLQRQFASTYTKGVAGKSLTTVMGPTVSEHIASLHTPKTRATEKEWTFISDGVEWHAVEVDNPSFRSGTSKITTPFPDTKTIRWDYGDAMRHNARDAMNQWAAANRTPYSLSDKIRLKLLGMSADLRDKRRAWELKQQRLQAAHTAEVAVTVERANGKILSARNRVGDLKAHVADLIEFVDACNNAKKAGK